MLFCITVNKSELYDNQIISTIVSYCLFIFFIDNVKPKNKHFHVGTLLIKIRHVDTYTD